MIESAQKAAERTRDSARDGQLGLYALAHFEMTRQVAARVELYYVGPGIVGSAEVKPEYLARARERAECAAAGIRAAQFPATPNSRICGYCAYSRFCIYSAARGPS